jgi:hypothetical protein
MQLAHSRSDGQSTFACSMALVHGEDLMKLYALAVERAPARLNRVGAGINGL